MVASPLNKYSVNGRKRTLIYKQTFVYKGKKLKKIKWRNLRINTSGTIKVNAEAIGNMILKVKVGNNAPLSTELQGKMKAIFPYTVSEESYVYIYGGESSSVAAKGTRAADTESVLKIYGIEWSETYEPSGIESLNNGSDSGTVIYNLSGLRVKEPTHGVYVKNGRKVIVK